MPLYLIIPGAGGRATESMETTTATGNTYDMRRCRDFSLQQDFETGTPSGTFQVEQSFDMTNWENLGTAITAGDGDITLFNADDGPFGTIRFAPDNLTLSSAQLDVVITGFPRSNM